jgi:hypothetical protein
MATLAGAGRPLLSRWKWHHGAWRCLLSRSPTRQPTRMHFGGSFLCRFRITSVAYATILQRRGVPTRLQALSSPSSIATSLLWLRLQHDADIALQDSTSIELKPSRSPNILKSAADHAFASFSLCPALKVRIEPLPSSICPSSSLLRERITTPHHSSGQ